MYRGRIAVYNTEDVGVGEAFFGGGRRSERLEQNR